MALVKVFKELGGQRHVKFLQGDRIDVNTATISTEKTYYPDLDAMIARCIRSSYEGQLPKVGQGGSVFVPD